MPTYNLSWKLNFLLKYPNLPCKKLISHTTALQDPKFQLTI